jgi:hypothetical protein
MRCCGNCGEYDKTVRKERALPRKKLPVKQKLRAKKKLLDVRSGSIYQLKKALKKGSVGDEKPAGV